MTEHELPLQFGNDGLISAVITDTQSGDVLMIGFMNREAVDRTRSTGLVHFWSRSRQTLWKKGESSGHVQRVQEIRVNCDLNSLLIEVDQEQAVCHDGYATCYYRRLEHDNTLTTVRDRQFDPADVYPHGGQGGGLASVTRQWWATYEWLRDHDVTAESGTSRRLRSKDDEQTSRIVDELRELAGVLGGTHRHGTLADDIELEAGQVLYWIVCSAVFHRITWDEVRPDRALDITGRDAPSNSTLVIVIESHATELEKHTDRIGAPALHELMALVGSCLRANQLDPFDVIDRDLSDFARRPYFSGVIPSS